MKNLVSTIQSLIKNFKSSAFPTNIVFVAISRCDLKF